MRQRPYGLCHDPRTHPFSAESILERCTFLCSCGKSVRILRGVNFRGPRRKHFRWGKFSGSLHESIFGGVNFRGHCGKSVRICVGYKSGSPPKAFSVGYKKQDVIRPVFPLLRQARADVLFSSRTRVRPESVRAAAKSIRHTSVNSLLEQEGQGGSLSYSPTLTSVRQLVQR